MRRNISNNKYFKLGVTALTVIVVALLFNQLFRNWSYVAGFISVLGTSLRPIIYGLVFAYLLNPLMKVYEKYAFGKLFNKIFKKNKKAAKNLSRGFSVFFAILTAVAIIAGLILLILPELYVNVNRLVTNFPGYVDNAIEYLTELSKQYPEVITPIMEQFENFTQDILDWIKLDVIPNADHVITNLSMGIYGTFKAILDLVIGVIVAIYLLTSKEKYTAGAKKYLYAVFKGDKAGKIVDLMKYTDKHFGGFLIGKVLDSAIIGILSFIVFSIFNIPYALLVSVIVGVTNVIPFFGPFIGAIPSGILILLVNPIKAFTFVVLIFAIQQLDGNVIGPKILGEATGLDSFAIIFAILVFGGLFGIVGMIIGVPVFATVMGIITDVANKRLKKNSLPVSLDDYAPGSVIVSENKNIKE